MESIARRLLIWDTLFQASVQSVILIAKAAWSTQLISEEEKLPLGETLGTRSNLGGVCAVRAKSLTKGGQASRVMGIRFTDTQDYCRSILLSRHHQTRLVRRPRQKAHGGHSPVRTCNEAHVTTNQ